MGIKEVRRRLDRSNDNHQKVCSCSFVGRQAMNVNARVNEIKCRNSLVRSYHSLAVYQNIGVSEIRKRKKKGSGTVIVIERGQDIATCGFRPGVKGITKRGGCVF